MLKVTKQICDFDELYRNCWGQAREILEEIMNEGRSEELMDFLEDLYPDGVDEIEVNDLIAYDWEWLYTMIDMPKEAIETKDLKGWR